MSLRIWHKLFLALLAATVVVVLVALVLTRFSFNRGFLDYLNTLENSRVEVLATALAEEYQASGDWNTLVRDRRRWDELMDDYTGNDAQDHRRGRERRRERGEGSPGGEPDRRGAEGFDRPPPEHGRPPRRDPPPQDRGLRQRVDLLDANGDTLLGRPRAAKGALRYAIDADGETVGFIRYLPMTRLTELDEEADRAFITQQRGSIVWIALGALLVATLLALLLARQLVAPVRALAAGSRALAAGRFDERISVTSRDELGQLATDFNTMAATLEQDRVARRQWIVDISHELRTPLSILQGELEGIEDGLRPWNEHTRASLHSEVVRMTRLVEDLHELSLADAGGMGYDNEKVDFIAIVERALDSTLGLIATIGLELRTDLAASAEVTGDPRRLEQLVHNLLQNSCRYTDSGGEIHVSCTKNDTVRLVIEDSTPGVPAEALPRLFERLYRVDESRSRATGGSGLGLAICESIVTAHGGTIAAQTSELGGLRIVVELPSEQD